MSKLGLSNLDVFPLCLGGNTFGWTSDEATSHAVLDAFVEQGGNFIDTADVYSVWAEGNQGGESERIIGSWLARRQRRDDVIIATKVAQHPEFKGLSAANIQAAADASLARLGTGYIDLYYAHQYDQATPVHEIATAFDALVKAGKIRHIGISNFPAELVDDWMNIAEELSLAKPVALQPHYNLVAREDFETNLQAVAERHELAVVPYFALASGFLSGKYRSAQDLAGAARAGMAGGYLDEHGLRVLQALEAVSAQTGAEMATVALAWLRTRSTVAAPIASARTVDQLPALMASATLELDAAQLELLDAASSPAFTA